MKNTFFVFDISSIYSLWFCRFFCFSQLSRTVTCFVCVFKLWTLVPHVLTWEILWSLCFSVFLGDNFICAYSPGWCHQCRTTLNVIVLGKGVVTSGIWISVSNLNEYRSVDIGVLQGGTSYFHLPRAKNETSDCPCCLHLSGSVFSLIHLL